MCISFPSSTKSSVPFFLTQLCISETWSYAYRSYAFLGKMGERRPWYCFSHSSGRKTAPVLGNSIEEILYVELEIEVLEKPKSQTGNCEITERLTTAKSRRTRKGLTDTVMRRYSRSQKPAIVLRIENTIKHTLKELCMDMLFHRTGNHVLSLEVSVRDATQELVGSCGVQGSNFLSSHPPVSRQCLPLAEPDRNPWKGTWKCSFRAPAPKNHWPNYVPNNWPNYIPNGTGRIAVIWFAVFFP